MEKLSLEPFDGNAVDITLQLISILEIFVEWKNQHIPRNKVRAILEITSWILDEALKQNKYHDLLPDTKANLKKIIQKEKEISRTRKDWHNNGNTYALKIVAAGIASMECINENVWQTVRKFMDTTLSLSAAVAVAFYLPTSGGIKAADLLISTIWDAADYLYIWIKEKEQKEKYLRVLYIHAMVRSAIKFSGDAMIAIEKIQDMMQYEQENEKSWIVLYSGLDGLQKIMERVEDLQVQKYAFSIITDFYNYNSSNDDSWRIREKVAEICIIMFRNHPDESICKFASSILNLMNGRENEDKSVKQTLADPDHVAEVKELLFKASQTPEVWEILKRLKEGKYSDSDLEAIQKDLYTLIIQNHMPVSKIKIHKNIKDILANGLVKNVARKGKSWLKDGFTYTEKEVITGLRIMIKQNEKDSVVDREILAASLVDLDILSKVLGEKKLVKLLMDARSTMEPMQFIREVWNPTCAMFAKDAASVDIQNIFKIALRRDEDFVVNDFDMKAMQRVRFAA